MNPSTAAKRATLRDLHASGCFVIPNPWDVGSARYLQTLGFKALATTSSGCAWSLGRPDNAVSLDEALDHLRALANATDVPVSADFEGGFADEPEAVGDNVARALATGIAGLSIEDSTGRPGEPLYDLAVARARVEAARAAIDAIDSTAVLTARAEGFLVGRNDLSDVIMRLTAYAEAGADCLYAPGLRTADTIRTVVAAVAPKPVNVLVSSAGMAVADLAALGVRRISVGGALARTAWGAFMRAAIAISEQGSFAGFADAVAFADLNGLLKRDFDSRNRGRGA
ncbi:MAG TPA: isocitrate lyase/phosphoenolpyruvate mutase family protein [Casimicrobiaceae bacterium]|jgi:2-methylisocitrate lyase-like PEP mutase family enzyme